METFFLSLPLNKVGLKEKFQVEFLEEAVEYLESLDDEIWEFRTKYAGKQHRLFAFGVKENRKLSLVIATHRFVKKVSQVSKSEINKMKSLKKKYTDGE